MAISTVAPSAAAVAEILDSPEVSELIAKLEALRWTGRKGYPVRVLVGACLAKSLYAVPTWTRLAALVAEHRALAGAIGGCPSHWAMYRFAKKLRENAPLLDECLARVLASLREVEPQLGRNVAVDATDLPAYANGQRFVRKGGPEREHFSDPDASWGHRSAVSTRSRGGFYGYKLHAAVCAKTALPLAWSIETGRTSEHEPVERLLDHIHARGFTAETCAMDKGYDSGAIHEACMNRGVLPIVSIRMTSDMLKDPYEAPECEHGLWTFAGADFKRKATKWRCPTGECHPKSVWRKASRKNSLVPRQSKRWRKLYNGRSAIEREFGRLKNQYGIAPLRVRRIERVTLHADLTMLARLSLALARARAVPLAA